MRIPEGLKPLIRRLLRARLPDWRIVYLCYRWIYRAWFVLAGLFMVLKKMFWVDPIVRVISVEVGDQLQIERVPYINGHGRIWIGSQVYISGLITIAFNHKLGLDPELRIGDHSFVGHGCAFTLARSIQIGNHCRIAGGSRFYDNNGHPFSLAARRRDEPVALDDAQAIVIEDDAWIGANCIIFKGVRIGRGAIVGAGSMVTGDVPPGTIVAGNPARVIRALTEKELADA